MTKPDDDQDKFQVFKQKLLKTLVVRISLSIPLNQHRYLDSLATRKKLEDALIIAYQLRINYAEAVALRLAAVGYSDFEITPYFGSYDNLEVEYYARSQRMKEILQWPEEMNFVLKVNGREVL